MKLQRKHKKQSGRNYKLSLDFGEDFTISIGWVQMLKTLLNGGMSLYLSAQCSCLHGVTLITIGYRFRVNKSDLRYALIFLVGVILMSILCGVLSLFIPVGY